MAKLKTTQARLKTILLGNSLRQQHKVAADDARHASELVSLAGHAIPGQLGTKCVVFRDVCPDAAACERLGHPSSLELIDPTRLPYPWLGAPL